MKKGFTLIEMLATVVLMLILTTIVGVSVVKIKQKSVEELYENKIIYIENAAISWGEDNINNLSNDSCENIYVRNLIINGYIVGDNDDKSTIINPKDGSSMNNLIICVKYEKTVLDPSTTNESSFYKVTANLVEK